MVPGRAATALFLPLSCACALAACAPEAPDPPLASAASALKVCAAGDTVPGVDVSHW